MLERKCVKSYRPLQHRSGVTRFKQVENQPRNHALRKRTRCQCIHGNGNSLFFVYRLKASHYFMLWFDATNFRERNKNQTMWYLTVIHFMIWQFTL